MRLTQGLPNATLILARTCTTVCYDVRLYCGGRYSMAFRGGIRTRRNRPAEPEMNPYGARSGAPVLFASTNDAAPWGGSEELWFETALQMARDGWPVVASVVRWPNRAPQLAVLEAANVDVLERGLHPLPVRAWLKAFPDQKYNWLRQIKPRFAVISQGVNFDEATIELGEVLKTLGVPYVVISQSAFPWFWPADGVALRLGKVLNEAAASYFVSEGNAQLTRLQMSVPLENARLAWNPFRVDFDQCLPYPHGEMTRIACVGRLEPSVKGQDMLFDVLSRDLWRDRPLHVTVYGEGPNSEILKRLHRVMDVRNASFGGYVHPRDIWRQNEALILPSRAEGVPIVVMEAMLCGRICIATDVGAVPELIEDGVTGFIAKEISSDGIADALQRAWERRREWQAMGELAAAAIRRKLPRDPVACLKREIEALMIDSTPGMPPEEQQGF